MLVWRICKRRRLPDAFSGIGAEAHGGRWNNKGDRVVYTSTSLSLAALELFVHVAPDYIPVDLVSVVAIVPDNASAERLTAASLPKNWRDYPAPTRLRELGSNWLREMRSLLLIVPSAVNPREDNILINPRHPEMTMLSVSESQPFHFDPRMWKS